MSIHHNLINECIPHLLEPGHYPLSILYIGAHPNGTTLAPELLSAGHTLSLLELVPNYARRFMKDGREPDIFGEVYIGDVRQVRTMDIPAHDVVVWWHGPEHVPREQLESTVADLECLAMRLIVMACPFGDSKMYRTAEEAEAEDRLRLRSMFHLSKLYVEDFERMEYEVHAIGIRDGCIKGRTSHLLAWKWVSHG